MKVTDDVRAVLESDSIKAEGNTLKITAQLERKLYVKVDQVLRALGGKWNRSAKAHLFDGDAGSAVEQALVTGEVTTARDIGFFPTPLALAARMVDFVLPRGSFNPRSPPIILEPSAGIGSLVGPALACGARVVAVEWDNKRRDMLRSRFVSSTRLTVLDTPDFLTADFGPTVTSRGILFDGILANPPFCKVGQGDHLDHLMRMLDLLKSSGRLACVMPRSIEFRTDTRHVALRARIELRNGHIKSLPPGTFRDSGTMVNTSLVLIGD